MKKWYRSVYRRHLLDMHINDDKEIYLSKFNINNYLKNLKEADIQCAMIYIQAHTGLCYFKSKAARTHAHFLKNPHEIRDLMTLCKKAGIKVVGYYSLIFNNYAVKKFPDFAMKDFKNRTFHENGERYELCCPNNQEYRKFIIEQLKEIEKENFPMDAIFFDMPYYEMTCACKSCKARFKKETGLNIPLKINFNNKSFIAYLKKRQEWMGEFTQFVKKEVNKILPNLTVEFNYAAAMSGNWIHGSTEVINEASEFTGGDLYGDLYNHSFAAKYYYLTSKNQPFEYMTCRCNPNLREHSITKPTELIEGEIMLSALHHGASLIIDAINPDGTMDDKIYKKIGAAFKDAKKLTPTLDKGEMHADVAIYFDSSAHYHTDLMPNNYEASLQAQRTLIENHIPHHIISNLHLNNLNRYQMIIASSLFDYPNNERLKLIKYVKEGGTLYLSGKSDYRLIKEFFNATRIAETYMDSKYPHILRTYQEVQCYVNPKNEYKNIMNEFNLTSPLPLTYKLPLIKIKKGKVMANIVLPYTDPDDINHYASIHSNPPAKETNYPAIIETKYGKGKVIYTLPVLEFDKRKNFKDIFIKIIKEEINLTYPIKTSKYVEMLIFKDKKDMYLHLFDLDYVNEISNREFVLTLPKGKYVATNLFTNKKYQFTTNFKKSFNKYSAYKINQIK